MERCTNHLAEQFPILQNSNSIRPYIYDFSCIFIVNIACCGSF